MTDDFVMPPVGPEMDALVAEALGDGWVEDATFEPSKWPDDAMIALEVWRKQHPDSEYVLWSPHHQLPPYTSPWDEHSFCVEIYISDRLMAQGIAPTLAEAICRAIILAAQEVRDAKPE